MNATALVRGVTYSVFALSLLATAIALSHRRDPPPNVLQVEPSAATDSVDAEFARCKALGIEGANDAACKAIWQANRERFLNSKNLYQDRVTDDAPAAPDPNEARSVLSEQLRRRGPVPAKRAGQPQ